MSAALIDLVSVGAQDVYITGDPQVSFFRQNYKRHTNFAIKPERLDFVGKFLSGNEVSIPIKSKGDLLSYIWLEGTNINNSDAPTSIFNSNANNNFTQPTEFSLWVGGQEVCKIDTGFINTVHTHMYNENQAKASTWAGCDNGGSNQSLNTYVIPFFFSEDWTKSLPLVGLQYHEVEVRIKCRNGDFGNTTVKAYASYVFLDTEEREFFANNEHELLITQTQYQPMEQSDTNVDLTYFNHPVKSIHIAKTGTGATYLFDTASLYINGTLLFENMSHEYHRYVVPQNHCSVLAEGGDELPIASWPFCLTMNKSQPTGSLNFSRIDNAKITIVNPSSPGNPPTGNDANCHFTRCYAVNYNILRIKNGMGGIAFGN